MLPGGDVAGRGEQHGDVARESIAERPYGGVVTASDAGQRAVLDGVLAGLELSMGRVGLRGAHGGLDREDLEVGERRTELLLGNGAGLLQLAQDGAYLEDQPALLSVGTQEQADVRWGR